MKANELMLGDWVSWTHGSETRKSRVSSLHKNAIFLDECPQRFMLHEIEPISLTKEILKANGWQLLSNYDREAFYDPNGVFSLDFRNGLFRLIIHGNIVVIEHVHELQHALRLCGLNDLADNFKVE